jgi:hypothetical protein
MLRSAGTDIMAQQELLRAPTSRPRGTFTQTISDQKRVANRQVVEMVLSGAKNSARQRLPQRMGADCDLPQLPQTASSD